MLQMLNFDNNGNDALNPSIFNEPTNNSIKSWVSSALPGQIPGNNNSINNNSLSSRQNLKHRVKSANPKIKIKESKNAHRQKETIEASKPKNVNEMFPDIYESAGNKNEEKPKITKKV